MVEMAMKKLLKEFPDTDLHRAVPDRVHSARGPHIQTPHQQQVHERYHGAALQRPVAATGGAAQSPE